MVLEKRCGGKITSTDIIIDFDNREVVEKMVNNILGHEIFAIDPDSGQENIREEIVMKAIKCRFANDSVVLVTGTDPQAHVETYAVVAEVVDNETLGRRKIILVGSSEQLRQLHAAGKMSEYAGLSEKLQRKKVVLYLKLFDGV